MKKFSLSSLILLCFAILSYSRPSQPQVDKFSYLMGALTRPYTGAFERIKSNTEGSYKQFQSLLSSTLSGTSSKNQDTKLVKPKLVLKGTTEDDVDFAAGEGETGQSFRNLAASCAYPSFAAMTVVNVYSCNGVEVSKSTYESGTGCTVTQQTKSLCYCPYDAYGDSCQTLQTYTCEIERVSHPLNCEGTDSFNYVYSYSGIPPCYPVDVGQTVTYTTKAICSPANSQYDFEGVKPSIYEVVTQPTFSSSPFTYQISNSRLHIITAPSPVFQTISFTNWKIISSPTTFTTSLTVAQIAGEAEIDTDISFTGNLTQAVTIGRYYFEISLSTSSYPKMSTSYNGGYFEQAGYVEPPAPGKVNKALIISLSVVGGVLVIAIIVGYKLYQKKKLQREKESVDAAPLVADQ